MRFPRVTAASCAVLFCAGLVACGTEEPPAPPAETTTATATTTPTTTPTTPPSTSRAPQTTEATSTTGTTVSSTSKRGVPDDVAKVEKIFGSVAPASLFRQFESCNDSGINDSWECSGPEVGQFQFFRSMSKAASTTQLITELRSSRVVEDTGRTVVGWSTLGTTAVITVVDNEEGLVMQQMVSSDRVDPEERIYDLGLVERPSAEPEETAEAEA
ncbi:hypothetical protein GCM10027595_04920 [Corynebacterium nasicanis]